MAWYECTRCGEFKSIRAQSVRPGTTVTCGCSRKQFIEAFQQRAANLPTATQRRIFELARHRSPRKLSPIEVANKFKLTKYIIDFVIAARCAALRAIAKVGNVVMNALSRRELDWVQRFQLYREGRHSAERDNFLASLHWRIVRLIWLPSASRWPSQRVLTFTPCCKARRRMSSGAGTRSALRMECDPAVNEMGCRFGQCGPVAGFRCAGGAA